MRDLKILGSLVVAAAVASTMCAAIASADQVTSPTGTTYTGTVRLQSEGHSVTHNPIARVECASSFEFKIETHGPGEKASGKASNMKTEPCTDSWHVTVVTPGVISLDGYSQSYDGDVFSHELTVEKTRFGITCRYRTNTTTIGRLTGGSPATVHVEGTLPFHSGSIFCGSGGTTITGAYLVTSPSSLFVDNT